MYHINWNWSTLFTVIKSSIKSIEQTKTDEASRQRSKYKFISIVIQFNFTFVLINIVNIIICVVCAFNKYQLKVKHVNISVTQNNNNSSSNNKRNNESSLDWDSITVFDECAVCKNNTFLSRLSATTNPYLVRWYVIYNPIYHLFIHSFYDFALFVFIDLFTYFFLLCHASMQ